MTIKELTALIDTYVKAGSISIDERIETLDKIGELSDQISDLSERLSEIPEPEENENGEA